MAGAMAERRRSAPRRGRVAARASLDPVSTRQGLPIAALLEGGAAPIARVRGAPQGHRQPHDRGELQRARPRRWRARASQPLSAHDTETSLACAAWRPSRVPHARRHARATAILVWRLLPCGVTQGWPCHSFKQDVRRATTLLTQGQATVMLTVAARVCVVHQI